MIHIETNDTGGQATPPFDVECLPVSTRAKKSSRFLFAAPRRPTDQVGMYLAAVCGGCFCVRCMQVNAVFESQSNKSVSTDP